MESIRGKYKPKRDNEKKLKQFLTKHKPNKKDGDN